MHCEVCILFQYLCKHGHLPEFERFLAIEPVDKIVAPIYRGRDMLPKWFSMYEELTTTVRLPPRLRQSHQSACAVLDESRKPDLAPKALLDPETIDNTKTLRSILTESADVARAATASILPVGYLLSSSVAATVSRDADAAISNIPTTDAMLQCSLSSDICHPADSSTNVAQSNVLIITADQLQQLGFNADMLPVVMTSNTSQVDTSLLYCDKTEVPSNGSFSLSSATCHDVPESDTVHQPATTAITTSPNLIGRAFASAVGISIDQLSSFADVEPDDNHWNLPLPASSQLTTAAASVPGEVICSISNNSITIQDSEQSVAVSVANVDISCTESSLVDENISLTTGPDSGHIFGSCDVDVSALDITMLNSSLSPLPSQPCEHHINNDSTLATPKKMECSRDDETLTFAAAKIGASDEARILPSDTVSATVSDIQYPVSCTSSEVGIFGVSSALPGSMVSDVFANAVSSGVVISTVSGSNSFPSINSVPVSSPAHGMALLSSTSSQTAAEPDSCGVRTSAVFSVASSMPVPASPQPISIGLSSFHQTKQIPMHHMRSPPKLVPSNRRPILPRNNERQFSSSKPVSSSFLSKPKPKKPSANVHAKPLPAIAPKGVVAKAYLSPVKQAAASIRARAKRLQSSPSRNAWYGAPRLKTAESAKDSVRPAVDPSDVWTLLNDDDDEAASGEGEELGTDVDSQLEDECEEDVSALSAELSPSLYVEFVLFYVIFHARKRVFFLSRIGL